jgi:hypothetical protein
MNMIPSKIKNEIKAVGLTTLYFGLWFCLMVALKKLTLAEYRIEFQGLSMALFGALVIAKVVLVLEHVPLPVWIRNRPALVHVLVRTALYALGVYMVLLFEKGFEGRHEYGGFISSLIQSFHDRNIHHVWATAISVTFALLGFNVLFVIRRHLGKGGLARIFLSPLPEESK